MNQTTRAAKRILWVDDEVEMLESHMVFLRSHGYEVSGACSGEDALEMVRADRFDMILLDEMMPGLSGLDTLEKLKTVDDTIPIVMITKSEEEHLMDEAIGKMIDDYLTKPVNPTQVLSVIKRHLQRKKIQSEHLTRRYVADFNRFTESLHPKAHWSSWIEAHVNMSHWDLDLEEFKEVGLDQTHREHKKDWNVDFGRYIEAYYPTWVADLGDPDRPPLSIDIVPRYLAPHLKAGKRCFFFVIDCMRLDQWYAIESELSEIFQIERDYYYSLLPTATPYSRNAIFSGKFADRIKEEYPELWQIGEKDEFSRNRLERQLLDRQLEELGITLKGEAKYVKVLDYAEGENLARKIATYQETPLLSVVYNFVDHLAHGRIESELLKELAPDEAAYRGLVRTWFVNSSWFRTLRAIAADPNAVCVITTDHGSIMGLRGATARGKRDTSANLRYKYGDNINASPKEAVLVKDPAAWRMPMFTSQTTYLLAREDFYFIFPTNFNEYQRRFQGMFMHGGISMSEMILPVATLTPR